MAGLTKQEIYKLVFDYIGVSSGYLGDFSYSTHEEFYPRYCDLDIDPNVFDGTTKERFISIISNADSKTQAKIVRGVLTKYRLSHFAASKQADMAELRAELEAAAARVDNEDSEGPKIQNPTLNITSEVVERALKDAESLLERQGPVSGIDRIHTALHGYLTEACRRAGLLAAQDASLPTVFNMLIREHPAFQSAGREGDVLKILRSFGAILDSLGPIRNMASMAHPTQNLLGHDEAMLVIHAGWTVLHYVDSKIAAWSSGT